MTLRKSSNSYVRQRLEIDYERLAAPELFVVYEFASNAKLDNELRVVLDETTTSVAWPLSGNTCRWSFQCLTIMNAAMNGNDCSVSRED